MGFIGDRFAAFMGDSGADKAARKIDAVEQASELIPWRVYDAKREIFVLDDGYGVAVEVLPVTGGGDAGRRLQSIVNQAAPADATIQILNWASPAITQDLFDWWTPRAKTGGVAGRMARERVKFIEEGRYSSVVRPIVLPHKRRVIITARLDGEPGPKGVEALVKFRKAVEGAFRDLGGARPMKAQAFVEFCGELLHVRRPSRERVGAYNPLEPMNGQFAGGALHHRADGIGLSGYPAMSVGCAAVQRLPAQFNFAAGAALNGVPDNPEMRPLGPVLTTMVIRARGAESARATSLKKVSVLDHALATGMAKFDRHAADRKREWERVAEESGHGERLVDFALIVCAYAAEEEATASEAVDEMRKIWATQQFDLGDETFVHLPLFLAALPFGASKAYCKDLKSMQRMRVGLTETAAFTAPLHGEWGGHQSPSGMLLFGRAGQMVTFDPFMSQTNYNIAVSGRSGSGKSVAMQELTASLVASGGRAIVVDDGRSFENTARALGGDFITFDEEHVQSINPFSLMSASAMEDEAAGTGDDGPERPGHDEISYRAIALGAATSIAVTIATSGSGEIDRIEREMIARAVERSWDEKGARATFTDVRDHLDAYAKDHDDKRAEDLAMMFRRFSKGGEYARWFEGKSDLRIDSDLTVFELGDIKSDKLMKAIVLQIIMFLGEQLMFNTDRSVRVGLIIDEAWDLLDGAEMGQFIGGIARRARKHSGMLVTGTQSINDFYANPAAQATVENSDWVMILSQKAEAIENLRMNNRLNASDWVRLQLASLRKHDGAFSEIAIRNSDGAWAFLRLVLDPYSIAVYSSKGSTVERLKQLERQGVPLEDAIQRLVEEGAS